MVSAWSPLMKRHLFVGLPILILALVGVVAPFAAEPATTVIVVKVVGVTDGDTLTLLVDKTQIKVRLEGIDAPESGQDFGTAARKGLSELTFGKEVRVASTGKDKYGRTLGHVYAGKSHVNIELLKRGLAWHYKEYNSDATLAAAETEARKARRGLWSIAAPISPWDFRHGQSNAPLTKGATPKRLSEPPKDPGPGTVTVYVTKSGAKYHRDGCSGLRRSKIPITLEEAKKHYGPCQLCRPPE